MHILGITDSLGNVGGAELSARTILASLAEREDVDRVTVVGLESTAEDRLDFGAAEVVPVSLPHRVESLPDLAVDVIAKRRLAHAVTSVENVDVVHAHHRRSSLALSHTGTNLPTVATVRDYWPACPISIYDIGGEPCTGCDDRLDDCVSYQGWDGPTEPATKAYLLAKRRHQQSALSTADCAVFTANHLLDRLAGDVSLPDYTETIYNPVALDTAIEPRQFEAPTFVTASSLSDSKGVEIAIKAMDTLHEDFPEARLLVFGDGPRREHLESLANKTVPNMVAFYGRTPPEDVYKSIAGASATVFPSMWDEPFGRVTVESIMLGTPVVGSDVGGISELIEHGETGLLFPPGDDVALADAMRSICSSNTLGERLASAAIERVEVFDPPRVAEAHRDLYTRLLEVV